MIDWQAPAALGIVSHFIFANYEPSAALIFILYTLGSTAFVLTQPSKSIADVTSKLILSLLIYKSTLFISIGIYRLFLHRVRHFPGPRTLALSKWAAVPMDLKGKRPEVIDQLHRKYGNVVRTGPRELSINDMKAVNAILGPSSKCIKGPWYNAVQGGMGPRSLSLHATISPTEHKARRRIWDAGFSVSSLKEYDAELIETKENLMSELDNIASKSANGQEVNIDHWFMFFAFDIMGKLGFSKSFNLLGQGGFSKPIELLEQAMEMIMVLGSVPYMAPVARLAPNALKQFEQFTENALKERVKQGASAAPDLYSHLLGEDKETGWQHTWNELNADAGLIVVAGSDTSSSVMSMTIYNLITHPQYIDKIRDELDDVFERESLLSFGRLRADTSMMRIDEEPDDFDRLGKECHLLNAVINESMRLFPPVPSGIQRMTPPQGITIPTEKEPTIIPGNIVISIPTTSLHRDSRYFSPEPNSFRPERWIDSKTEDAFEQKAFIPFGFGPTGCVGKALAWMEMRLVLATLIRRFDLLPKSGFDYDRYPECIKDAFTMARTKPLPVVIKRRQSASIFQ